PEEETPGIDFIIPNIEYLIPKRKNIRGIILTHGHLDHIGATPYLVEKLGNPPIYTTDLTGAIAERRQQEFHNAPRLQIHKIKNRDRIKVGNHFELEFFGVAHTIPETMGVVIKTPAGNVVHFADFRIEYDEKGVAMGLEEYERISKLGIHSFLIDSTNSQKSGVSISEKVVQQNLEELFKKAEGRIIVGTFSSMITRIAEMINIADRLGRVVAISGRSMIENLQIAQNLGHVKPPKGILISLNELHRYRDNKIMVISTGAQGEENASLMRVITGEHRQLQIKPGDMVVLSSSVVPGNERSVQNLKDNLARQGAVVYTSGLIDIHASGHAPQEDLKLVMGIIKPKFVIPVHGYYFMRTITAQLAHEIGVPRENTVLLDNGQVAEITPESIKITGEQVPAYYVMVDGLGIGDVGEIVLRDRKMLAEEGMVVIIATLDKHTGRVLKNPDIISRGFIYLKENAELLDEIRKRIRGMIGKMLPQQIDSDYLKTIMRDQIGQYLYTKTRRRPMILPVVIEV
ncbi:MAG: ribonuclease J, partial [Candidatus Liptonbacteria bacterium]|nr:ribonuclease J [Candidatus Liptonbacteria bacterium]